MCYFSSDSDAELEVYKKKKSQAQRIENKRMEKFLFFYCSFLFSSFASSIHILFHCLPQPETQTKTKFNATKSLDVKEKKNVFIFGEFRFCWMWQGDALLRALLCLIWDKKKWQAVYQSCMW